MMKILQKIWLGDHQIVFPSAKIDVAFGLGQSNSPLE
jgi:hypothetical protein